MDDLSAKISEIWGKDGKLVIREIYLSLKQYKMIIIVFFELLTIKLFPTTDAVSKLSVEC